MHCSTADKSAVCVNGIKGREGPQGSIDYSSGWMRMQWWQHRSAVGRGLLSASAGPDFGLSDGRENAQLQNTMANHSKGKLQKAVQSLALQCFISCFQGFFKTDCC